MAYCVRCARTIGFSALPIPASEISSTIKEKPVIFEKSTHAVSEIKQDISIKKPIKIVAEKPKKPIVTKYDKIILAELSEKKRIPFGSRNLIYIAQDSVGAFLCGVTTDLGKEAKSLNNGGAPDTGGMPIEIVYYRTEKSKDSANNMKKALLKLDHKQKEQLVQVFEKQYF
jgi:predicted GIY-YIG superfamily endonuclease